MILHPPRFNECGTIHVEDWHEEILVLLEKFLEVWILLHVSQLYQLQHLKHNHRRRDHLSCMSRTCEQDSRFLPSLHDVRLGQSGVPKCTRFILVLVIVRRRVKVIIVLRFLLLFLFLFLFLQLDEFICVGVF